MLLDEQQQQKKKKKKKKRGAETSATVRDKIGALRDGAGTEDVCAGRSTYVVRHTA